MIKSIVNNVSKIFAYIFVLCSCVTPFLVGLWILDAISKSYLTAFLFFFLFSFITIVILAFIRIEAEY